MRMYLVMSHMDIAYMLTGLIYQEITGNFRKQCCRERNVPLLNFRSFTQNELFSPGV